VPSGQSSQSPTSQSGSVAVPGGRDRRPAHPKGKLIASGRVLRARSCHASDPPMLRARTKRKPIVAGWKWGDVTRRGAIWLAPMELVADIRAFAVGLALLVLPR
jgi:hypothetical protein